MRKERETESQLRALLDAEEKRRRDEQAIRSAREADLRTLTQLREHALQGSDPKTVTSVLTVESAVMGAPIEPVLVLMVPKKEKPLTKAKPTVTAGGEPMQTSDFLSNHPDVAAFLTDPANSEDGQIAINAIAQLFTRRDGGEIDHKLRIVSIRRAMEPWEQQKANANALSRKPSKGRPLMVAADRAEELIKYVDGQFAASPRSTYRLVDSEAAPKKA